MLSDEETREIFRVQAGWCAKLGSEFTAQVLLTVGEVLDRSTLCGRTVFDWPGNPQGTSDALALRLAGALHGLVRAGRLPELAKLYPPHPLPSKIVLTKALRRAIVEADEELCKWLAFAPQTNEVARSSLLYCGMGVIARETGLSLSIFELGASAGLNLLMDCFAYKFGNRELGYKGSGVYLSPLWHGPVPDIKEPHIIERAGCDLNPLNVADPAHRARLLAYIWPDQGERLARTEAAIEIARSVLPRIQSCDGADWVERTFPANVKSKTAQVLFHSIAFQYFPEVAQNRITAHMQKVGAEATPDAPVAWLSFEHFDSLGPTLTLRLWRGDKSDGETRVLAEANNAHVHKVKWLG